MDTDPLTGSKLGDSTWITTDGGYLRFQLAASFSAGQFEYTGNLNQDFDMSCDFWSGGGSGADSCYFYWGALATPTEESSDQDNYAVVLNEFADQVQLKWGGANLATASFNNLDNSTWRTVHVYTNGDRIEVYVDSILYIDFTDTTRVLGGTKYGWAGRSGSTNNEHRTRNLRICTPVASTGVDVWTMALLGVG